MAQAHVPDRESLSPSDAKALLERLINSLIRCLNRDVGPIVIRKLCSTLVVYFLQFSSLWTRCVRHLIQSLSMGEATSTELLDQSPDTGVLVGRLSSTNALAALWFSAALAEEVGKTDGNNIKQ